MASESESIRIELEERAERAFNAQKRVEEVKSTIKSEIEKNASLVTAQQLADASVHMLINDSNEENDEDDADDDGSSSDPMTPQPPSSV